MFKATKSFFKASVLAVAAVICASCAQEDSVFGTHEKRAKDVTISVSMNETRTVNDGISTKWSANDAITLLTLPFDGTGYYPSKFTYHQDENGNRFRGRIEDYGEMNSFYAFYPYRNDILTPKDYRIDINANPVQEGNTSTAHLAGTDFPLYGKQLKVQGVSNINISMSNILAVARFVVTNTTESPIVVKSIEFTSSNYITGSFNADMTVDDPAWTADKENASTKVTLAVNNGEEIAAGGNAEFYVGILPNVCPAGSKLKIKITASTGEKDEVYYRLIELTSTTSFYSGYRKEISCPFNLESSTDPWPESEEQDPDDTQKYYYKLTSAPENWEGTYLIVDESNLVAFAETKEGYKTPVEIIDGKIAAIPALAENQVTITASTAGAGKFDLKTILNQYLYGVGSGMLHEGNIAGGNTYYNIISISGGNVVLASTYGQSQKRFCYSNGSFDYVNDESGAYAGASVALYRLGSAPHGGDEPGDDPTKEDQTISFSSDEYNWTIGNGYAIGGSYSIPNVSGAKTAVTYSSSNTNVAAIDNSKIVINATGTTVITATAAETDEINGATASFTLNIIQSEQPSESVYVKVTSEPTSWDGVYLVVDESGKVFVPFDANATTYVANVTININGTITPNATVNAYAITVSDAGRNHDNSNLSGKRAYNVRNSEGMYIWWSSNFGEYSSARLIVNSTNTATNSNTTYEYYHTFAYSNGGVQMASAIHTSGGNAYYLAYGNNSFAYSSDNSSKRVQLYKLSEGEQPAEPQEQTLSFANSSISWTLGNVCEVGGTYNVQALGGTYFTAVSYTSSNTSVATIVDGNKIQVQGTGTTTITATAAASGSYKSATASYTLTINPNSGSGTTAGYELLTSVPSDWSGSYLIVNVDKTYLFNGETGGSGSQYYGGGSGSNRVSLSNSDFSGNVITNTSYSQYAFTITKSGNNYYIKKGNNYYYCSYSSNSSTGIVTTTSQSNAAWTFESVTSGHGFLFYQYESSQNQYIYYKDSENSFKFGKSGQDVGILLYKLNDGTISGGDTPDTPDTPEQPETGDYFVKVSSNLSDWSGTYLVVDENSSKAFSYSTSSSYATNVTISGGKIAYTQALDNIALRVSDAGLNHPNTQIASDLNSGTLRAYNVKTKEGQYIYASSSEIQVKDTNSKSSSGSTWGGGGSSSSTTYYHTFHYSNGAVYMISSGNYGSGSSNQQYYYSLSYSSNKFAYNQGKNALKQVQLYKLNGTGGGSGTDEPAVDPVTPTPQGTTFNIENDYLKSYLDAASTTYTNSSTQSIVAQYIGSSSSSGYPWGGGGVANDLPKPVTLTWTGNATSISIFEGTSATGTAVKTMTFSNSTSADVYNLIPGKNYTFRTSNGQTGTFNVTGRRRMIKVSDTQSESHARNCRDLGGSQTRDGKTLKYGLIYRGTNVDDITTEEKNILYNELGIRLDQDLRNETRISSSPIGSDVEFCHHGGYDAGSIANQNGDNMKQSVLHVMNAVIEGRPVYCHCRIGSDRTGHMCMLYLALLGCELKDCDIDYEITSFASKMTSGTRTIGSGNEQSFRNKFINKSIAGQTFDADHVPEAVERYVTETLGIDINTVKAFRRAMGASETLPTR